jgi:hypothetical protein
MGYLNEDDTAYQQSLNLAGEEALIDADEARASEFEAKNVFNGAVSEEILEEF